MNFLSRSAFFISFFISFGLISNCLLGQDCPKPFAGSFLQSPGGFDSPNGATVEVTKTLTIKANTSLSLGTQNSIRYRIGYFGATEFKASDFNCAGNCKTNPNVVIPTLTSFEIVQTPDLSIVFNMPGNYFIIQTYTDAVSGIGYYACMKIVVYPIPKSTYRTCGCDLVLVTIPPIAENLFYDEIEVLFTFPDPIGQKFIVPKADFGKEITNSIPIGGGCADRSSFKVTGFTKTAPIIVQSEPLTTPIKFTSAGPMSIYFIKELRHELNDDFYIQFSSNITDGLEVSYDAGSNWSELPVASYLVVNSGKEFVLKGLKVPTTGDICFRGFSSCGGVKTAIADRPSVCFTGEIDKISDEFSTSSGKREVKLTLKSKNTSINASVLVLGDYELTSEYGLSSGTNEYFDDRASCNNLTYRTKTSIYNTSNGSTTTIFSKPVSYKISAATIPAIEGTSLVSIKSTSFLPSGQIADLSYAPLVFLGKNFNFYKSINQEPFIKLNTTPVNQFFFQDFSTDPTVKNCYYVKAQDQCGYESSPSKTICTTLLKSNGNLIEWTKDNVAVDKANNYEVISGYTPQTVVCSLGNCVGKDLPSVTTGNNFNMDIADTAPLTVHSVNVRVQVNIASTTRTNVYSNIIEYYFQPKLFIPNIITPNNDTINDELVLNGFHVKNLVFDIYDRWGEKIETLTNINQKWIPVVNLPEGEYFYKASATDFSPIPNQITKQGSILLVR